ncbi:MAG: DUF4292 domain-containing protein [Chitinophagaceae bacterium]
MRKTAYTFFLISSLLVLFSCRSTRHISSVISGKDSSGIKNVNKEIEDSIRRQDSTVSIIKMSKIKYETFASRVKIQYHDSKDRNYEVNAIIRIKKDSIIWVSINAILGIEAFRVLITPDTVSVLDRLEKTIRHHRFDYLKTVTNLPVDFATLQDLIVGNPVFLDSNIVSFRQDKTMTSMTTVGGQFKNLATFLNVDLTLQRSKLDDVNITGTRSAELNYQDYEQIGSFKFPGSRNITVSDRNRLDVHLEFKQNQFDQVLSYPFSVPGNYKLK